MISGSGRAPGEGNGNPLQYSGQDYPKDRGAWWAIGYGVTKESMGRDTAQQLNKNNNKTKAYLFLDLCSRSEVEICKKRSLNLASRRHSPLTLMN